MRSIGVTAQKAILLLLAGLSLGFSYSPSRARRILKVTAKEWKKLNRQELYRAIRKLYESQLVNFKEDIDGSIELILNKKGRQVALRYKLDEMKIPITEQWDRKWRVILFDIPEDIKELRDTLRTRFQQLGLIQLQKSVFVHPYECRNEVDFVIELYDARRYVRFIEANHIDNELHLKKKFKLL